MKFGDSRIARETTDREAHHFSRAVIGTMQPALATGGTWRGTAIRWLKFNAVGGLGIGVQLTVLLALKSGFHLNYLLATALAVEAYKLLQEGKNYGKVVFKI